MAVQPDALTLEVAASVSERFVSPDEVRAFRDACHYNITDAAVAQVEDLAAKGYDVALVDVNDAYATPGSVAHVGTERMMAVLENQQRLANIASPDPHNPNAFSHSGYNLFRNPLYFPAMPAWATMLMKAEALHTLYGAGDIATLGEGINPAIYTVPLFSAENARGLARPMSARDLLAVKVGEEKADEVVGQYQKFIETPIDPVSRVFYVNSADAMEIRARARMAWGMALANLRDPETGALPQDLTVASLGCGAAGPLYGFLRELRAQGGNVAEAVLVDQDSFALASAYSLAQRHGVADIVNIQKRNLMREPAASYMNGHRVQLLDMIGLYEYIPTEGPFNARDLLIQAATITEPGGTIIIGNMLNTRPQQEFFDGVIQWPRLQQRSIHELFQIIESAGFDPHSVTTRVTANNGLYAVYAIRVPENWTPPLAQQHQRAA